MLGYVLKSLDTNMITKEILGARNVKYMVLFDFNKMNTFLRVFQRFHLYSYYLLEAPLLRPNITLHLLTKYQPANHIHMWIRIFLVPYNELHPLLSAFYV
jgi:hypothetical protein